MQPVGTFFFPPTKIHSAVQQGLSYLLVIAILCIYRTFPHHRALMHFPQIKALSIHSALGWGGRKSGHIYSGSFWYPKSTFQAFHCSKRLSPNPAKLSVSFRVLPTQRALHSTVSTGRKYWCSSHSPNEGSSHCVALKISPHRWQYRAASNAPKSYLSLDWVTDLLEV